MNFIDSNIIAYAFYENEFRERCQKTVQKGGIINSVTLLEAFNIIEYNTSRLYAIKAMRALLRSNLIIINVDINMVFNMLRCAERYKQLKCIDLLHYLTAKLHNCEAIVSYDKDFDRLEIPRVQE